MSGVYFPWGTSELSYLHSRDITYAIFCQGPYDESKRYYDFMGWDMPWYSAVDSLDALLLERLFARHAAQRSREGARKLRVRKR